LPTGRYAAGARLPSRWCYLVRPASALYYPFSATAARPPPLLWRTTPADAALTACALAPLPFYRGAGCATSRRGGTVQQTALSTRACCVHSVGGLRARAVPPAVRPMRHSTWRCATNTVCRIFLPSSLLPVAPHRRAPTLPLWTDDRGPFSHRCCTAASSVNICRRRIPVSHHRLCRSSSLDRITLAGFVPGLVLSDKPFSLSIFATCSSLTSPTTHA